MVRRLETTIIWLCVTLAILIVLFGLLTVKLVDTRDALKVAKNKITWLETADDEVIRRMAKDLCRLGMHGFIRQSCTTCEDGTKYIPCCSKAKWGEGCDK